jgi:hypothetical protein
MGYAYVRTRDILWISKQARNLLKIKIQAGPWDRTRDLLVLEDQNQTFYSRGMQERI